QLRTNPTYAVGYRTRPSPATNALIFNTKQGPMTDVELRHRVASAIDPNALARKCFPNGPRAARSFLPPVFFGEDVPQRKREPSLPMQRVAAPAAAAAAAPKAPSSSDAMAATMAISASEKEREEKEGQKAKGSGSSAAPLRLGLFPAFQNAFNAYSREVIAM